MNLSGKTILITGGTSGIGLELARRFLAMGNTVIVTGRDAERIRSVQRTLPGVHAIRSDVSQPSDIVKLHEHLMQEYPTLDVLVNNAGIMRNIKLHDVRSLEDIAEEIEIDLNGPIRMVQQFLPHLLSRPEAMIVNVTSGLAFVPFPASPVYSAAKAGLRAYTRALRVQVKGSSLRVVEIAPPGTDTPLLHNIHDGIDAKGPPAMPLDKLADEAIAGIAAGKTEIQPGMSRMLYVLSRLAPEFGLKQLTKASGL
ncbi:SDR family NAD(P)-dependent oxidoreductase [Pseudomonas cichorii]|uniref:SDR family oxidoreductase n=1 Tax=Pseudomonas lijiangensis TaxID=2995658 RepID=UPI001C875744|nr:SDR family NAD(P)-dependent oxidoreductase [Pseudomonas cichorii]MBX8511370.1 SDR family NAD(P)-dependent oxidoreductase [Pseudomonas cichorii]MBX8526342.1 SDR family NAD(P)-dependent oxidoreductase [Pseudomonas cichorii]MBX8536114.1 SDR family NAD(P)-dependent oxidoreductase [Pseudomonas cichorii]MBX8557329.1 SDR family NAD(P)-dependent oxidoreductase [Pseudomonas cichorii]MBX8561573.1 SDR family NAD(P)-dependent oxidoreductase [Pseudomonas cichorii]